MENQRAEEVRRFFACTVHLSFGKAAARERSLKALRNKDLQAADLFLVHAYPKSWTHPAGAVVQGWSCRSRRKASLGRHHLGCCLSLCGSESKTPGENKERLLQHEGLQAAPRDFQQARWRFFVFEAGTFNHSSSRPAGRNGSYKSGSSDQPRTASRRCCP